MFSQPTHWSPETGTRSSRFPKDPICGTILVFPRKLIPQIRSVYESELFIRSVYGYCRVVPASKNQPKSRLQQPCMKASTFTRNLMDSLQGTHMVFRSLHTWNVRVSERKNGDDVVSALNRESLAIQRQKRYGTFTTRETVLPVALPSAL